MKQTPYYTLPRWVLLFLLVLLSTGAIAQKYDFNEFSGLRSSGDIPLDFRQWTKEKYTIQKAQISKDQARWVRKAHNNFIIESNFFLNEVLLSGYILFNDPITTYINKVADKLLEHDQVLRQRLHFYAVKSSSVNAFATDPGIIFVNVGLLAQLENEAQLAFILAHEITHYTHKHTLSLFLEGEKVPKKQKYTRYTYNDKVFAQHHRSREMENEADKVGLELYANSNYSFKAVNGVFDVLLYANLPFDERPFPASFIELPNYKIPSEYFLTDLTQISNAEDYDDSESTHPNIKKRREYMNLILSTKEEGSRTSFMLGEKEFIDIRNLARFECLNRDLVTLNYGNVIYNTYIMRRDFSQNAYLDKVFATALYGLAKYKNNGHLADVLPRHTTIEGQSQQAFFLFRQFKAPEITIIALYHCYTLHRKYPKDAYLKAITEDLFLEMKVRNKIKLEDFKREIVSDSLQMAEIEGASGKYERIRISKKHGQGTDKLYDAFIDLFDDPEFEKLCTTSCLDKEEDWKKLHGLNEEGEEEDEKAKRKKARQFKKHGNSLGKNKIVVVDPLYYIVDKTKKNVLQFLDSEEANQIYKKQIITNAQKAGLAIEMLDTRSFKEQDVDRFNNFSALNDWFIERIRHGDNQIIPFCSQLIPAITKEYETDVFVWTGALSLKDKYRQNFTAYCSTMFNPFLLPIVLYRSIAKVYANSYYYLVVDVSSGTPLMIVSEEFDMNDYGDISNSFIYDTMLQIKKKPKK